MKTMLIFVSSALVAFGCSGTTSHGESTKVSSAALTLPGLTPQPVNPSTGKPAWQGTQAELIFADAFAECSYQVGDVNTSPTFVKTGYPNEIVSQDDLPSVDSYLQAVRTQMGTAACPGHSLSAGEPEEKRWLEERNDPTCNKDPSTDANASANLTRSVASVDVPSTIFGTSGTGYEAAAGLAQLAIETPIQNLCIAEHLRAIAPGTMGGEGLLLSAADQRVFVELEKERAQLAMLQFALLEETFATPDVAGEQAPSLELIDLAPLASQGAFANASTGFSGSYLALLRKWADSASGDRLGLLTTLGQDFATSVQLHVQVAGELAQLLARSASARLPRGGGSTTDADDQWGSGSWRQRALASLYGGDPLVQDPDGTSPWKHFLGSTAPGQNGEAWPTREEQPYVRTHVTDPHASLLFDILNQSGQIGNFSFTNDPQPPPGGSSCFVVDPAASAVVYYQTAEYFLRLANCTTFNPSTQQCDVSFGDIPDPSTAGFGEFELWKRFQITPQHAAQLASQLADELPGECFYSGEARARGGALSVNGSLDPDSGTSLSLVPHVLREYAPLYGRNAHFSMPTAIDLTADAASQGYRALGLAVLDYVWDADPQEAMRLMGSVAALGAVRSALQAAAPNLPGSSAGIQAFAATNREILDLIDAAAGKNQIAITPRTTTVTENYVAEYSSDYMTYGNPTTIDTTLNRSIRAQLNSGGAAQWNVDLLVPVDDEFYDASHPAYYTLISIPDNPAAAYLARYPNSWVYESFTNALAASGVETSSATTVSSVSLGSNSKEAWHFDLTSAATATRRTLIVKRNTGAATTYRPLLANLNLTVDTDHHHVADAQYYAFEGSLSSFGQSVLAKDAYDPAAPAYDGFGLPNRFSPPSDPALFAGAPGTDAVANYLTQAQTAAQAATQSVTQTFQELLNEEQDQAQLAAAVAKQHALDDLQQSELCGSSSACDTTIVPYAIDPHVIWNIGPYYRTIDTRDPHTFQVTSTQVPRPTYDAALAGCALLVPSSTAQEQLDCIAATVVSSIALNVKLLHVVTQHLADPINGQLPTDITPPSFSEFEGGTLQNVAIQQWLAVVRAEKAAAAVVAASDAALSQVSTFQAAFELAQNEEAEMARKCSLSSLYVDLRNCSSGYPPAPCPPSSNNPDDAWDDEIVHSGGGGHSEGTGGSLGFSWGLGFSFSGSSGDSSGYTNTSPSTGEKRRLCEEYRDKLSAASWQVLDAQLEAVAALDEKEADFIAYSAAIQTSSANALQLIHQADLAKATNALETSTIAASQVTSFGLYREVHSYDVFRSQALLDNARLMADIARKAIEAKYVVNLSELTQPEPFVASPSSWADDIYQYDMSMPEAVGLEIGDAVPGGVALNKVLDYVDNLQRFVQGYAIARPTAVAQLDTEVLTLPGPIGLNDGTSPVAQLPDGRSSAWSYYCPSTNTWIGRPTDLNPMDACLPGDPSPTLAQVQFQLDPWGRVNGDVSQPPFAVRFNDRWTSLAVNLVGTGILDCTKAADPLGCYAKSYVSYNLSHSGTPWITDSNEIWRILGGPTGAIEGAKALAAEQWLDPINNAWDKPYVAQIARTEFTQRALGGLYDIVFQLGPEVQLQNIERVQILAGSTYWVSQK